MIHWISCEVLRCAAPTRRCSAVVRKEQHGSSFQYRRHRDGGQAARGSSCLHAVQSGVSVRAGGRSAAGHREAGDRRQGGLALSEPAGRHRFRQDVHHGKGHRGRAEAHAGHGSEQDAGGAAGQRAEGVLSRQRRGVLRVVLRLLPTRGVRALVGHVHREGRVHQRRGGETASCGHVGFAVAARLHRGGVGVVHLRHWQPDGLRRHGRVRGQAEGHGSRPGHP